MGVSATAVERALNIATLRPYPSSLPSVSTKESVQESLAALSLRGLSEFRSRFFGTANATEGKVNGKRRLRISAPNAGASSFRPRRTLRSEPERVPLSPDDSTGDFGLEFPSDGLRREVDFPIEQLL
eukprot:c19283_g1_i1 orf=1-378(-)